MKSLSDLIKSRPNFKSNRSEYLKLAVKEGKAVRGTGPHRVKLMGCKNAKNKDYQTQQEVKGVDLLFKENGEPKRYFVPILGNDGKFHYLIERFAEIEEGTELILEYQRRSGSAKGFISVQIAEKEEEPSIDVSEPKFPQRERGGIEVPENGEIPTGEPSEYDGIPVVEDDENIEGFNPEI